MNYQIAPINRTYIEKYIKGATFLNINNIPVIPINNPFSDGFDSIEIGVAQNIEPGTYPDSRPVISSWNDVNEYPPQESYADDSVIMLARSTVKLSDLTGNYVYVLTQTVSGLNNQMSSFTEYTWLEFIDLYGDYLMLSNPYTDLGEILIGNPTRHSIDNYNYGYYFPFIKKNNSCLDMRFLFGRYDKYDDRLDKRPLFCNYNFTVDDDDIIAFIITPNQITDINAFNLDNPDYQTALKIGFNSNYVHKIFDGSKIDDVDIVAAVNATEGYYSDTFDFWDSGESPEPPVEDINPYANLPEQEMVRTSGTYTDTDTNSFVLDVLPNDLKQIYEVDGNAYTNLSGYQVYDLDTQEMNYFCAELSRWEPSTLLPGIEPLPEYVVKLGRLAFEPPTTPPGTAVPVLYGPYRNKAHTITNDEIRHDILGKCISGEYIRINMGEFTFTADYFSNFLEYSATKILLYLPFYGFTDLSPQIVQGHTIHLYYDFDIIKGTGQVTVSYDDKFGDIDLTKVIHQFTINNIYEEIPYSPSNYKELEELTKNAVKSIAGLGAAYAVGFNTVLGAAESGLALEQPSVSNILDDYYNNLSDNENYTLVQSANNVERNAPAKRLNVNNDNIDKLKSNFNEMLNSFGNLGVSSDINNTNMVFKTKFPFIIMIRPNVYIPKTYKHYYGLPCNQEYKLSTLKGFTSIKKCYLNTLSCMDDEKKMIKDILSGGIIL